jgi:hypothetical protein
MINERLYTKQGIQDYVNIGDLDTVRGQLVGFLNQQLASIPNTISMPINNLSLSLEQHSKPQAKQE